MAGLNDMQDLACRHVDGPLLILAGAGSGKTRVITHRVAYLMDEIGVNPYNILAITFTNKAAAEMRDRVNNIVGEGAERVWVSTFHSLCVRILRRFSDRLGYATNFNIYDSDDQKSAVKNILKELKIDPKKYPEKMFLAEISNAKERYISPDQYAKMNATDFVKTQTATVYSEYMKRLRKFNAFDFDDLIYKVVELFEHNPDVLELYQDRFRYIMVDEYQDTNHIQFLMVKQLASKYNTFGRKRSFKTSSGDTIEIGGGDYGWVVSKKKEKAQLLSDLEGGKPVEREPVYEQTALYRGADDIGNTYIEIDYTKQHMWYYKDGALQMESDFVSGNLARQNGSVDGVYKIVYKQRNATLVGEGYSSPVSYFMPFAYNIGIHDASWRDTFGGTIYKTSGSHGCINVPPAFAEQLFNAVDKGTPVVAYYREAVTLTNNAAKMSNAYSYVAPDAAQ